MLASLEPRRAPSLRSGSMGLLCAPRPRLSSFGCPSGLAGGPFAGGLLRPHPVFGSAGASFRGLPNAASSSGRSWGRGRSQGPSGPGRGGGRTVGRGGGGARPEHQESDDPAESLNLGALEKLVTANLGRWRERRLARAMNCAIKLGSTSPDDTVLRENIFELLAGAYFPYISRMRTAADCIIPLYACSRAGYWGPASAGGKGGLAVALLQRLSADGCALMRDEAKPVSDQDHANLWLALAAAPTAVRDVVDLWGLLETSASGLLRTRELSIQACSNVLLACARLQWRNYRLTHHLTACLVEVGPRADAQALSNALYALGELTADVGHKPRREDLQSLVGAVATRLAAQQSGAYKRSGSAASFIPQHFANILLGCANMGFQDQAAIRPIAAAAAQAAATIGREETGRGPLPQMEQRHLGNSAWALAKMGYEDQGWYAAAVEVAGVNGALNGAPPQTWSNFWYALALARHRPSSCRLLERTSDEAEQLRQRAEPQHCSNLLLALANLRLYDERLLDALAVRLDELLGQDPKQVKTQALCNSLWALAVMGPEALSRHSSLVESMLREAERRWEADGSSAFIEEGLVQLGQAKLELEAVGTMELQRILKACANGEGSLLVTARTTAAAAAARLASIPSASLATEESHAIEREVASALEQLQLRMTPGTIVSVQLRCVVQEVGRYAEAVVELAGGRRVEVETVRRTEVFANAPHDRMLLGPVALFVRQVERALGVGNVLLVPDWEWNAAKAKGEQLAYLSRLLGLEEV